MLAVFVGLGVVISSYTQSMSNSETAGKAVGVKVDSKAPGESPVQPSKTVKEVPIGDLLKVSNPIDSPLPTEIKPKINVEVYKV